MNDNLNDMFLLSNKDLHCTKQPEGIISIDCDNVILTAEEENDESFLFDISCPICMSVMYKPNTTSCNHTFCHSCIWVVIEKNKK